MWTARVRRRALRVAAAGQAAARPPAGLRGVLDLRVRRGLPGRARGGDRVRVRPRAWRPRLVALQPGRAFLQQPAHVERRAVHGAARHPPVGQVLDGRLARPPDDDLDHRRGRLRGLGRGVLHRLPVAAELRLPVDLRQRQGRVQLGRRRRVLQRDEPRPDADVAHRARPDRPDRDRRRARAAGPGARRLAPDRRATPREPRSGTAAPARHRRGRGRPVARPDPPVRHPQGRHDRRGDRARADLRPGRPAVLPGRAAGHRSRPGPGSRPADFLGTAATELNGTSETATYGPPYNNQTGSVQRLLFSPQTIPGVTQPVNAAQDFVLGPLSTLAPTDPAVAAPLATYQAAAARPAAEVGQRLRRPPWRR